MADEDLLTSLGLDDGDDGLKPMLEQAEEDVDPTIPFKQQKKKRQRGLSLGADEPQVKRIARPRLVDWEVIADIAPPEWVQSNWEDFVGEKDPEGFWINCKATTACWHQHRIKYIVFLFLDYA